jgi:hypothetical protein
LAVDLTSAGGNNDGKIFRRKTDYSVFRDNSGNIASDEDLIDVGSKDKNNDGWVIVNKQTNNYIRDASGGSASTQIPAVGSTEIVSAYSEPRTVSASQLAAARARVTDQIKLVDNINQVKLLALIDQLEVNLTKSIDVMSTQTTSSLDVFADTGYDPLDYDGLLGTSVTGTSGAGTSGAGTSGAGTTTTVTPLDVGASLVGSILGAATATAPPAWYTTPPPWWKSTTPPSTSTTMPISSPTYGSLLGADYSLFPVSTSTAGTGTQGTSTQGFSTAGTRTQGFSTSTQGTGTQGTSASSTSTQGTGTQGTSASSTSTQGTGTSGAAVTQGGIGISKANIPAGQEDLYILKTQAFPQGCPAGGCGTGVSGSNNFRPAPVPPCPPCERCPEPAFSCKKVPNYDSETVKKHLPQPVLASFSQFGM